MSATYFIAVYDYDVPDEHILYASYTDYYFYDADIVGEWYPTPHHWAKWCQGLHDYLKLYRIVRNGNTSTFRLIGSYAVGDGWRKVEVAGQDLLKAKDSDGE